MEIRQPVVTARSTSAGNRSTPVTRPGNGVPTRRAAQTTGIPLALASPSIAMVAVPLDSVLER